MKEVRVLRTKTGATYLVRFDYDGSSARIRFLDNQPSALTALTPIYGSEEAVKKAMKKLYPTGSVSVGSVIHIAFNQQDWNEESYKKWLVDAKKILEKKFEILDPLVIDNTIMQRVKQLTNYHEFSMTLDDFRNKGEKASFTYKITLSHNHKTDCAFDSRSTQGGPRLFMCNAPDKFNYLSFENGKIGFCAKKDFNCNHWNEARQYTKISKVVRSLFNISEFHVSEAESDNRIFYIGSFSDQEKMLSKAKMRQYADGEMTTKQMEYYIEKGKERLFEILASEFKPKEFDLLITDDIEKIYGTPKADSGAGTVGSSCMSEHNRGSYSCARESKFYNHLGGIKIIYALDENKNLLGRALVWGGYKHNKSTDQYSDEIKFVDRIYGSEDFIVSVRAWAAKNDHWWRTDQSAGSITLTNKDGKQTNSFKSTITKLPFGKVNRRVPYFDTMKYFNVISNSKNYAKLQLSSIAVEGSVETRGTSASIVIEKCPHCGTILVKSRLLSAYNQKVSTVNACENCSIKWDGNSFLKSKKDTRLTFSSKKGKIMPELMQPGRLVTVEIDGKKVSFDMMDEKAVEKFFKGKTKKGKTFRELKNAGRDAYTGYNPW